MNSPHRVTPNRRVLVWLILAGICMVHAAAVWHIQPTNFFGLTEDDSIYFTSAKALADGQGYVLPSVPGTPRATKYPILYPWILSWVWRWNPSFPTNLSLAVALNVAFGFLYLTLTFLFLRGLKGLTEGAALGLTAILAVNPLVILYSAFLMTEIPFAALALGSIILAERAIQEDAPPSRTVFCGILSGLTLLLRVMGAPIAGGLCVVIALRRGWRKAMIFAGSVAPFFLGLFWRSIVTVPSSAPLDVTPCTAVWQRTWFYYINYPAFWKAAALEQHTFWNNVQNNFVGLLIQPGRYFVDSLGSLGIVPQVVISAVAVRGIVRQVQAGGWKPVHFALALYVVPVLIWDYAATDRFLMPFLPLVAAGLWVEGSYLATQVRLSWDRHRKAGERFAASFLVLACGTVISIAGVSWWRITSATARMSGERAALLREKREAYLWLGKKTEPNARILAYEDASAFLYSGRQGMRPIVFSPAGAHRPEILDAELSCLTCSAAPIGATYWVVADDDFGFEWEPARSRARSREVEVEKSLLPLFVSQGRHVRVYNLGAPEKR